MDIQYIGKNIARLRISRGLSQTDLGKEIGLTASAVSNIETGRSYPSVDTLIKLADYFCITVDPLLTEKDVKQLEDLHCKSKLLTAEMYLRSGKAHQCVYKIGGKNYFLEEEGNSLIYKVSQNCFGV